MNASDYMLGTDMVGAAAAAQSGGPYIIIRVNNVNQLVASQGGEIGTLAAAILPATINKKVYDTMADQLTTNLKANGVDADVKVVTTGNAPADTLGTDLFPGMIIGAGIVGIGYGLVRAYKHFHKGKK